MDVQYEYLHNLLSIEGFEHNVHCFLKESVFDYNTYLQKKANNFAQLAWNLINGKGLSSTRQIKDKLQDRKYV
jgi:hypothetical protein